jgi:hypothetical protein
MGTNKIDQLFREKLDTHQSIPDIQAWGELENMIDSKKKKVVFWYYKMAASILLFLTVGFASYQILKPSEQEVLVVQEEIEPLSNPQNEFTKEETFSEPIVIEDAEVDQSNLIVSVEKPAPKKVELLGSNQKIKENQEKEVQYIAVVGDDDEIQQLALQEGAQIYELDELLLVDNNDVEIPEPKLSSKLSGDDQTSKKPKVRITYKSTPKKEKIRRVVIIAKLDTMRRWKPDFKNILKVPGNFLADVRDAKDFLFNPKGDLIETENIP